MSAANKTPRAVVIGASAGGIDALMVLFAELPATTRASLFVVVHLPPSRPSLLAEIFAARCRLPVCEAIDKDRVEPGTVYFAPPDYHLLVDRGAQIALSADPPVHYSRPAIDVLFESAAELYRDHLLGIVLTGASDDGADGLLAVHAAGGRSWVQDPADAVSAAMPQYAIARCPAAEVLPLPVMAARLAELLGA
jgi:two-component system chemotaxis response regulator CheB